MRKRRSGVAPRREHSTWEFAARASCRVDDAKQDHGGSRQGRRSESTHLRIVGDDTSAGRLLPTANICDARVESPGNAPQAVDLHQLRAGTLWT